MNKEIIRLSKISKKFIGPNKDIIIFKNLEEFKNEYFQHFEAGWPETQPWFEKK